MLDVFSKAEIFTGIPLNGLAQLAETGILRKFAAREVLMRQGDVSETMYVILSGRVEVTRSHPMLRRPLLLAKLGPGDVVGEMGLLDHEPRSATVTALEPTEAMELDDLALAQTILRYPEVSVELLKILSKRLRSTDELATEFAKRNANGESAQQQS